MLDSPDHIYENLFHAECTSHVPQWLSVNTFYCLLSILSVQIPEELLTEITRVFQNLIQSVHSSVPPEVTAYLKYMGNEMGYLKISEIRQIAGTLFKYFDVLFRLLPSQVTYQLCFLKLTLQMGEKQKLFFLL